MAERTGRPWQYVESPVRKDQRDREIATRDGITEGPVCVFATVESCRSLRLAYGRPLSHPSDARTDDLDDVAWAVLEVPATSALLTPSMPTLPLLAYHVAVHRGTDLDQRNLAKSVTTVG